MAKIPSSERFDCVAFKRQSQSRIYDATRRMNRVEQIAYFRKHAHCGPLKSWWQRVSQPSASASERTKAA